MSIIRIRLLLILFAASGICGCSMTPVYQMPAGYSSTYQNSLRTQVEAEQALKAQYQLQVSGTRGERDPSHKKVKQAPLPRK